MSNHKIVLFAVAMLAIIFLTHKQPVRHEIVPTDADIIKTSLASQTTFTNVEDLITAIPEIPDELNLESALVKNLGTNFYFFQHNISQNWPLASLTKLLTAVTAYEKIDDEEKVDRLVRMMMIVSDNQAAEALANIYGRDEFIGEMQKKADELKMLNTSIHDVSGLSFLNQSTVKDLEKLIDYVVSRHPKILQFSRESHLYLDDRAIPNINRFAGQPNFLGGKTGYTDEANGNLISIFQYHGQPILIIVLGTTDQVARFEQTKLLFEWISKFYK